MAKGQKAAVITPQMEERMSLPITRLEEYLLALLAELRAIRRALTDKEREDDLFTED